ncbi:MULTISPECIES: UDP-N-acetylglucosamine 1-carboxyvinyltransferase [Thermoanaerobacter]|uniref:UDP-N-acetylglucosamine 1-carboxyvinyltransferase n=1 Tax=Thermoanaerobacter uzonensis DSM 18761 TaxID=1123369 RepID=A0A1M4SAJ8_9THEO|nr:MULTISPECIES: UDP-N-acetylglucosamine 1-carboxyvinyltransferase [Thermoanaerobacter]UZQ83159.1 UDP-N-acetylglucosamine 1-carboxyvinyltransferase [Thermoanaerobacter sp. RKWS2]SFE79402.1 UDP-N-acetylglucosamine 1-carboxyvinyltransferase [Thermoanaerobacter thermohydrosulfuricus]SFE79451.1 UDP-N-acetylglucosamine 1-carboxyvinyltransferase [Thermoanaerobacter thermohydrosulfuricus]SHE29254.1 UDP-N-acetylglucosamine 1-carboxyvinyltransferase [Thermoanaerobacter uzonensis DSM 18761]
MIKTKFIVEKSPPLKGSVKISGAKNSVLPIIAASLLSSGEIVLDDIPTLEDVNVMIELIKHFGAICDFENEKLKVKVDIKDIEAPYDLVKKMRASFLVMGPILARLGHAKISMPGGCAIGSRPIDLHLKGFQTLGADITIGHGYVEARAKKLTGKKIYLDFPSVGATENIMMAAVFAEGVTIIENAAEEPEIVDLANFLNKMGANIKGAGTDTIRIEGVKELKGAEHTVIPDRIEAGTFMVAAAMTGGNVLIENVIVDHVRSIIAKLTECGIKITEEPKGLRVKGIKNYKAVDIKTLPYPGFPTDMQAQMMAMMTVAKGTSVIIETVFENRFMHVDELKRMGANIKIEGRSAVVTGVDHLTGAEVKATDLRAGAALVLAGLIAEGKTEINDIYHIDRGYVKMEEKLKNLGAIIYRK